MISEVSIPFRLATEAVRRNANLRRHTSALRAAARVADSLSKVGTQFPAAVLGGELLAMMSVQFRELLQQRNSPPAVPYLRSAPGQSASAASSSASPRMWSESSSGNRAAVASDAIPANGSRSRPLSALPPMGSVERPESILSRLQIVDRLTQSPEGFAPEVQPVEWSTAAAPARRMPTAEPAGTIARQLREYWDLDRKHTTAHTVRDSQPATQPDSPFAPGAAQGTANPELPRLSKETHLARQLQSFASSRSAPQRSDRARWRTETATGPEARSLRESSGVSLTGAEAFDFAERLTTLLHQQAIQHGIDLT